MRNVHKEKTQHSLPEYEVICSRKSSVVDQSSGQGLQFFKFGTCHMFVSSYPPVNDTACIELPAACEGLSTTWITRYLTEFQQKTWRRRAQGCKRSK